MTEKMTVTQGLLELKLLKSRINKAIQEAGPLAEVHTASNPRSVEQMETDIHARYASICDLINRRTAIKRAIVLSNATTNVKVMIGENVVSMTKAEAIDIKSNLVPMLSSLLQKIVRDGNSAVETYQNREADVEKAARQIVVAVAGVSNPTAEDVSKCSAYKEYIDANPITMVDPLDLATTAEKMDSFVHDFIARIDTALSVSNAVTEIDVEYATGADAGIMITAKSDDADAMTL